MYENSYQVEETRIKHTLRNMTLLGHIIASLTVAVGMIWSEKR